MMYIMYNIVNGLVGVPLNQYLVPVNVISERQHSLANHFPYSRSNYHLYFPNQGRPWLVDTGANCYKGVLRKFSPRMEMPSTVVSWKSTSRRTVQQSGREKTELTRFGQK